MTNSLHDWRAIRNFWFPPILAGADHDTLARMIPWWMAGDATAELPQFRSVLVAALAGKLQHWCAEPASRLSLILVLDQFTRGLVWPGSEGQAGQARPWTSDQQPRARVSRSAATVSFATRCLRTPNAVSHGAYLKARPGAGKRSR